MPLRSYEDLSHAIDCLPRIAWLRCDDYGSVCVVVQAHVRELPLVSDAPRDLWFPFQLFRCVLSRDIMFGSEVASNSIAEGI